MNNFNKLVWSEGTVLTQQHFQQWDSYHTHYTHFLFNLACPFQTGIKNLIINQDMLKHHKLIIQKLDAIFPNGVIVEYNNQSDSPLSLDIMPNNSKTIYIGLPITQHTTGITGYPDNPAHPAWKGYYQIIPDNEDSTRERELLLAKPNLVLLTEDDDKSQFYTLKILDAHNPDYIPPVIALNSAYWLQERLRSSAELLHASIKLLLHRQHHYRTDLTEFNHRDLADFLLLQLFKQTLPQIEFLLLHPFLPPIEFYKLLIIFLGNLSSFMPTPDYKTPHYNHEDLYTSFNVLYNTMIIFMEKAIPARMPSLKWHHESDTLYSIHNIDSRLFESSRFYLAVYHEDANISWINHFTHKIKIGARSRIEAIITSALPGIPLIHTQRPPNKLPVKAGYEYFYLEPKGEEWEKIKTERTLSLFKSYDFLNARIDLIFIEDAIS